MSQRLLSALPISQLNREMSILRKLLQETPGIGFLVLKFCENKIRQDITINFFFHKILLYICFLLSEIFTPGEKSLKSQESNRTYRPQEVTKRTNLWKLLKLRRRTIPPPSLGVGLQVRQGAPVSHWWASKWFNCLGINTMRNNPLLILLYSYD